MPAHRKADGVKAPYVMGYHTRADIPFQFALAEAFTICDAYHCSVLGPTWPNRMYWMTGTIDADGQYGGPMIKQRSGRRRLPVDDVRRAARAGRRQLDASISRKTTTAAISWSSSRHFRRADSNSPLYTRGMLRGPEGQFEYDAINDRLPAVSWIIPTSTQSEHPDYMPAAGAAFVASKIDAIAANPDVWAKTVFILNYDENDGIFDHVAPPTPPPGTAGEFIDGLPIGAGFRVPCIVVSPWTAGGWVCSQPFDHTSVLQFLERVTGVPRIQHHRLAPPDVRRSDGRLPIWRRGGRTGAIARHHRPARPRALRSGDAADTGAAARRSARARAGDGSPQARASVVEGRGLPRTDDRRRRSGRLRGRAHRARIRRDRSVGAQAVVRAAPLRAPSPARIRGRRSRP